MSALTWDGTGQRFFEVGVDRGVLYVPGLIGVPWNGLLSVDESPSGGSPTAFYQEGVKYLNRSSKEEFAGTIEAFTYPDEFSECDGTKRIYYGLNVTEQRRRPFGMSYRTLVGNDIEGQDFGYKIHIVYHALAQPSSKKRETVGEDVDPLTFSWAFTTTPETLPGVGPFAHIVIDSTEASPGVIYMLENILYGTDTTDPRLPTPEELVALFANPAQLLRIMPNYVTGLHPLVKYPYGDLVGIPSVGLYTRTRYSRLKETSTPGLFKLEQ